MPRQTLAETLRAGTTVVSAWVTLPDPLVAEAVARSAVGAVTLDVQHGLHDTASVMQSIAGIAHAGKPAIVRLAVDDFGFASRSLDFGAEAVIAPMINSVADAQRLVAATKYPPLGERSWGPTRAMSLFGIDDAQVQLRTANRSTLAIAMIETMRALDVLDDILAVEGLDGVFLGPSDLSVTFSRGERVAPADAFIDAPVRRIAEQANKAGKIAGAFAVNGERVRFYREIGYRLIALASDQSYLARGISAMLADVDGKSPA
jgi:4-hydroxy-2-oxoheptanedioate aldolase